MSKSFENAANTFGAIKWFLFPFSQSAVLVLFAGLLVSCTNSSMQISPQFDIAEQSAFNASDLCQVAEATESYLNQHSDDHYAVHEGQVPALSAKLPRVKQTLQFLCDTVREDQHKNRSSRLHDTQFLQEHFDFYLWKPDKEGAEVFATKSTNDVKTRKLKGIPEEELLLTKYYVKKLQGSPIKTEQYSQALYSLPTDEKGLSEKEALSIKDSLTRFRYTRREIIDGALLDENLAKPLIWLSENALHDVLLQGTGVIDDGNTLRYFNVHRNNGIDYDYSIGMREQQRYWYFAEVSGVLGYGSDIENKIPLFPYVSVAGNVEAIGLGKLFLIQYEEGGVKTKHLAILSDQGGAFKDNLFQLDLLVESAYGWQDYYQKYKDKPDYAKVWMMLKKNK